MGLNDIFKNTLSENKKGKGMMGNTLSKNFGIGGMTKTVGKVK
jgi:hypothetical protein